MRPSHVSSVPPCPLFLFVLPTVALVQLVQMSEFPSVDSLEAENTVTSEKSAAGTLLGVGP